MFNIYHTEKFDGTRIARIPRIFHKRHSNIFVPFVLFVFNIYHAEILLSAIDARSESRCSCCSHHSGQCSTPHNFESRAACNIVSIHIVQSIILTVQSNIESPKPALHRFRGLLPCLRNIIL